MEADEKSSNLIIPEWLKYVDADPNLSAQDKQVRHDLGDTVFLRINKAK